MAARAGADTGAGGAASRTGNARNTQDGMKTFHPDAVWRPLQANNTVVDIKLLTPLTNKITPESATKLNIPAGTLTALAVRARARARTPSHSNTALSGLLSLSLS